MKRVLIVLGSIVFALVLAGGGFFAGVNIGKAQAQDDECERNLAHAGSHANGMGIPRLGPHSGCAYGIARHCAPR